MINHGSARSSCTELSQRSLVVHRAHPALACSAPRRRADPVRTQCLRWESVRCSAGLWAGRPRRAAPCQRRVTSPLGALTVQTSRSADSPPPPWGQEGTGTNPGAVAAGVSGRARRWSRSELGLMRLWQRVGTRPSVVGWSGEISGLRYKFTVHGISLVSVRVLVFLGKCRCDEIFITHKFRSVANAKQLNVGAVCV